MNRPSGGTARLAGIDLARAVALLGMMLAHLGPPWTGVGGPPVSDWLAGGRSAALFAVLAGLSIGLMVRLDPGGVGSSAAVVRRGIALLLIGLGLASLPHLTILVILPCYGVLIAATVLVRRLSTAGLIGLAAGWCAVSPLALMGLRHVVDEPRSAHVQPSFAGGLSELPVDLFVWGGYPATVWFGYLLVGAALGRLDLADAGVARRVTLVGALATAGSLWVAATALYLGAVRDQLGDPQLSQLVVPPGALDPLDPTSLWAAGQHTSMPLNVIGAAGSAVLTVGLCLWLCRSPVASRLTLALRHAGSMTLTLYCLHVVLVWAIREHDLGFTGGYYREWWVQALLLVALACLWRALLPRGPLEQLVRAMSLAARPRRPRRVSSGS